MKRAVSIIIAVFILAMLLMSLPVSAEQTETGYIYFQVPTEGAVAWNNFKMVYCHMWSRAGGDVYGWQDKNERCEDLNNGYWRYDISGIDFDKDGEYSLIFSNENGLQTYNLNITSSCIGDIAYCKGDTCVNPVDGEKSCAVARWKNNGDKVYPAIEIDSNGKTLNPDEADAQTIETKWGEGSGSSYELPELNVASKTDETKAESIKESLTVEQVADKEDGINLTAATTWIIIVSAVFAVAVITLTVILARRNKGDK